MSGWVETFTVALERDLIDAGDFAGVPHTAAEFPGSGPRR
jgi:hypothetical protein